MQSEKFDWQLLERGNNMWKDKKAVIFDLDGTLVDSLWVWKDIDIAFLGKYGLTLPEDLQKQLDGMSFYETAVYMKQRFQLPETPEELMHIWNEMAEETYRTKVPLKLGVKSFLLQLKAAGKKIGIASSNSIFLIETTLRANGVLDLFDVIHSANEVAAGKPEPDIYLLVAEDLQVSPSDCLVFEDILQGVEAGNRAGMTTCAVYDKHFHGDEAEIRNLANYYIKDYTCFTE